MSDQLAEFKKYINEWISWVEGYIIYWKSREKFESINLIGFLK